MNFVIRNARLRGQKQNVDIAVDGEKISAVGPSLPARAQKEIDGDPIPPPGKETEANIRVINEQYFFHGWPFSLARDAV